MKEKHHDLENAKLMLEIQGRDQEIEISKEVIQIQKKEIYTLQEDLFKSKDRGRASAPMLKRYIQETIDLNEKLVIQTCEVIRLRSENERLNDAKDSNDKIIYLYDNLTFLDRIRFVLSIPFRNFYHL